MKRNPLVILFALVGGLLVLLLLAGVVIFGARSLKRTTISASTVLEIDLTSAPIEELPDNPFATVLLEDTPTVFSQISAIRRAATDSKVVGLVADIGSVGMGFALNQEYRDAIIAFRESGKPAIAYSETFGEFGPGNGAYYLATGFDRIYLQPSGDVGLNGISVNPQFRRGLYDKIEMTPQMGQRYEYKNAMNIHTERSLTGAHRESIEEIVDSIYEQLIEGIAEGRSMSTDDVRALVDRGPFLGKEAEAEGLVDELLYRDQAAERVRSDIGDDITFVSLSTYAGKRGQGRGPVVALISGIGPVMRGSGGYNPLTGEVTMGSDRVAAALRSATEDDAVDAIVFRVDSPGGSYVASDAIWRETVRAQEAGKPVVVTMGNAAASGGYFVSMWADKIVAQPSTLTGSIGVLGGKLVTTGTYAKLGLDHDHMRWGKNAGMFSDKTPYTDAEWERLNAWLDNVYEDFTTKVAKGRDMSVEQVHEIAKGRVWTGERALEIGLVDALGGYMKAFELVREEMGLEADADIRVRRFPERRSLMDQLRDRGKSRESGWNTAVEQLIMEIRPLAKVAAELTAPAPAALEAPLPELVLD
jgi:protease-4